MGKKSRCGDDEEDLLPKSDLIKILVWLPVVSLFRFKSVCKSWLALIESSSFINFHTAITFNSFSSSSKFGSFIFLATGRHENELFMLSESESESVSNDMAAEEDCRLDYYNGQVFKVDNLMLKLDNLGFTQYPYDSFTIEIIGSCKGLVCLGDKIPPASDGGEQFYLWNPATRQFRLLPKPTILSEDNQGPLPTLVAFCFDVETNDFKLVLLTCFRPDLYPCGPTVMSATECLCQVQVYSLSTDSWGLLEGITSLPGQPFPGQVLYLNGTCFFLARFFHTEDQLCSFQNDRFLISIDFTKQIITPIQLPDHNYFHDLYLSYLGNKIALFIVTQNYDFDTGLCPYEDFSIWVLNEHGSSGGSVNKEFWTKLQSFQIKHRIIPYHQELTIPRGLSNDGEFALLETKFSGSIGKQMKLYNLVTEEEKRDFLFCTFVKSTATPYKPSLVSITGGDGAAAAAAAADKKPAN